LSAEFIDNHTNQAGKAFPGLKKRHRRRIMSEQKKQAQRRALLALLVMVLASVTLMLVYHFLVPKGAEGDKAIAIEIIHGDGSKKTFPLRTGEAYLGPALVSGGVVEDNQGAYGLYILTADGETADESAQQWWCITKDGEQVNTGADSTPIADGDHFELTLTTGYDLG